MAKYVLLIEDDPALQKAYQMKFETKGVAARVVIDGKEMMQLLKQNTMERPGVVILDLLLPYVSGFEVLEEMRRTEGWHDVPVVIVSNIREEGGVQKAERLGVKNYFIKTGLNLDDAIEMISGYL
ncbi:response regulator [Candidatus Azambacteria bacterium]|nr:response regulator [Candidatus Azambacteria bacterium]